MLHYAEHNCYNILERVLSTLIWKEDLIEKLQLKENLRNIYTKQTPGIFLQLLYWRSYMKISKIPSNLVTIPKQNQINVMFPFCFLVFLYYSIFSMVFSYKKTHFLWIYTMHILFLFYEVFFFLFTATLTHKTG